ncbi:MAG: tol-pal system-associated acyl-CoA thioesterase, partial [Alphaproteobacteria bacterium]|nr:tol-pal system-associated acyl-CoA thioesterase [Alphaproteobacteria bacterium]
MSNLKQFWHHLRVYYEDTDAGGVVYYARYLNFMERARTEMLRECGADILSCQQQHGVFFVVKNVSVNYVAPARLDDNLTIATTVTKLGAATIGMSQNVFCGPRLLTEGTVDLVSLNAAGQVLRLPDQLR